MAGIATVVIQGRDDSAAAFAASEQQLREFASRTKAAVGPLTAEIATLGQRQKEMDQAVALGRTTRSQYDDQLKTLIADSRELAQRTAAGSDEQAKLAAIAQRAQTTLTGLGRAERTSVDGFEALAAGVQTATSVMQGNVMAAGGLTTTLQKFAVGSPGIVNAIGGIGAVVSIVGLLAMAWQKTGQEAEAALAKQRQGIITQAGRFRVPLNLSTPERLARGQAQVDEARASLAALPGDVAIPQVQMLGRQIVNQQAIDDARALNAENARLRQVYTDIIQIQGAQVGQSQANLAANKALEDSLRGQRDTQAAIADFPRSDAELEIRAGLADAARGVRTSAASQGGATDLLSQMTGELGPTLGDSLAGAFEDMDAALAASLPNLVAVDARIASIAQRTAKVNTFAQMSGAAFGHLITAVSSGGGVVGKFLRAEAADLAKLASGKATYYGAQGIADLLLAPAKAAKDFLAAAAFGTAAIALSAFAGGGGGGGGGGGAGPSASVGDGGLAFGGAAKGDVTIVVPADLMDMPNGAKVVDWLANMMTQVDGRNVRVAVT